MMSGNTRKIDTLLWMPVLLMFAFTSTEVLSKEELVFGIHPFKKTVDLMRGFTPLAEYLSNAVGKPVRIEIAKDYETHADAAAKNVLDIAYMGPALYIDLVDNHGSRPILGQLQVKGSNTFRGAIVVNQNSSLKELSDLSGKRFAFGDPISTMSHLVPSFMLQEAGITKNKLSSYIHLDNHSAVALSVLSGMFDAGAVKEEIYYKYEERGLKVLTWSPNIPEHVFVARADMPQQTVHILRDAMLKLASDTYGSVVLHAIKPKVTALTVGKESDFDNLRLILRTLGDTEQ
jgi:phosphonate transport system substrate-binding protein